MKKFLSGLLLLVLSSLCGSAQVDSTVYFYQLLRGWEGPVNLGLVASVGSNALTIAVKGVDGNDPSATNPVVIPFRSPTAATGIPEFFTISAATSFTISSGSTLGTANSVPFRLWILGCNDAGTMRIGAINATVGAASPTQVVSINEEQLFSSTAEGGAGAADTAGILYTGTAISTKACKIFGFAEYSSGLATAGTYASTPTKLQVFSPGIARPGTVVQVAYVSSATSTSTTSNAYQTTNLSKAITPTSAPNLIRAVASGIARTDNAATAAQVQIHRGTTAIGGIAQTFSTAAPAWNGQSMLALDAPGTTSSTTYAVKVLSTDNVNNVSFLKGDADRAGTMILEEIQG